MGKRIRFSCSGMIWLLVALLAITGAITQKRQSDAFIAQQRGDIEFLLLEIETERERADVYYRRIIQLQTQNAELIEKIERLETWVPVEMEVTGYAPLDENAVEGMCYSGDPAITASGAPSQPGISIAAGPGVSFGTEIYIPGYGVGVVHDRGGAIGDRHIDLMFATRGQALGWGRQTVTVWARE